MSLITSSSSSFVNMWNFWPGCTVASWKENQRRVHDLGSITCPLMQLSLRHKGICCPQDSLYRPQGPQIALWLKKKILTNQFSIFSSTYHIIVIQMPSITVTSWLFQQGSHGLIVFLVGQMLISLMVEMLVAIPISQTVHLGLFWEAGFNSSAPDSSYLLMQTGRQCSRPK